MHRPLELGDAVACLGWEQSVGSSQLLDTGTEAAGGTVRRARTAHPLCPHPTQSMRCSAHTCAPVPSRCTHVQEECATAAGLRGCGQRPRHVPSVTRGGDSGRLTPYLRPHTSVPDQEGHYSRALIALLELLGEKNVVSARSATTLGGRRRGHLGAMSSPGHAAGGGAAPQPLKEPKHAQADVGGRLVCVHLCVLPNMRGDASRAGPAGQDGMSAQSRAPGPAHPRACGDGLLAGRGKMGSPAAGLGVGGALPWMGASWAQGQHEVTGWARERTSSSWPRAGPELAQRGLSRDPGRRPALARGQP